MVISGLARGIDLAAHQGALAAGGITGAVLASGVDMIYPKSSRATGSEILMNRGFFVSEYSPGSQALPVRFPVRNRIIAGLCRAVIVVEAPQRSGSLITADFALDCGREVLVHSGSLDQTGNEGVTGLYRQGACAVSSKEEFFQALSSGNNRFGWDLRETVDVCYGQGVI
jgi:DNA processing protein